MYPLLSDSDPYYYSGFPLVSGLYYHPDSPLDSGSCYHLDSLSGFPASDCHPDLSLGSDRSGCYQNLKDFPGLLRTCYPSYFTVFRSHFPEYRSVSSPGSDRLCFPGSLHLDFPVVQLLLS